MCYIGDMNITIRNIDEAVYRQVKAAAATEGIPVGIYLSKVLKTWFGKAPSKKSNAVHSVLDIKPIKTGPVHASERVDEIVYGHD